MTDWSVEGRGAEVTVVSPEGDVYPFHIASVTDLRLELSGAPSWHDRRVTEATRGLIDAATLSSMRPRSILLNAARDSIIDEGALVEALEGGRIHGAGLDVFAREPLPADDPLLAREDVVFSPHCAALTAECLVEMGMATVRNVLAAFDGTLDPRLIVNGRALIDSGRNSG